MVVFYFYFRFHLKKQNKKKKKKMGNSPGSFNYNNYKASSFNGYVPNEKTGIAFGRIDSMQFNKYNFESKDFFNRFIKRKFPSNKNLHSVENTDNLINNFDVIFPLNGINFNKFFFNKTNFNEIIQIIKENMENMEYIQLRTPRNFENFSINFFYALSTIKNLECLILNELSLNEDEIIHLINCFNNLQNFQHFTFFNCQFTSKSFELLFKNNNGKCENNHIKSFHIGNCNLFDKDFQNLSYFMKNCKNLQFIELSHLNITCDDFKELCGGFICIKETLKAVRLINIKINPIYWEIFGECLENLKLKCLLISFTDLEYSFQTIMNGLLNSIEIIEFIEIISCNIQNYHFEIILNFLKLSKTIEIIKIYPNNFIIENLKQCKINNELIYSIFYPEKKYFKLNANNNNNNDKIAGNIF